MEKSVIKWCGIFIASMLIMNMPLAVHAAGLTLHYGSEDYEPRYQSNFKIGLYLNSDAAIGDAKVELKFNPDFMEYVSVSPGNAYVDGDVVTLQGKTRGRSIRYMLNFRSKAGGAETIRVIRVNDEPVENGAVAPVKVAAVEDAKLGNLMLNGVAVILDDNELTGHATIPYAEKWEYNTTTPDLTITPLIDASSSNLPYFPIFGPKGKGNSLK